MTTALQPLHLPSTDFIGEDPVGSDTAGKDTRGLDPIGSDPVGADTVGGRAPSPGCLGQPALFLMLAYLASRADA